MEEPFIKNKQTKKVEELHWECQKWKSHLQFIEDEIVFIDRLLNSYIFQPNTPNLFERLQGYLERLKKVKSNKKIVRNLISQHENDLGGMIECTTDRCDMEFYQKHNKLKAEVVDRMENFMALKSEVFNYAGGILKKRKPE
ncbi:hypothetical protein GGR42_002650 [Saonia flava]|uniref:Uncharacterized protein n=1 Tax=Saonia flava TaxID=523696 RepID=A0A846R5V5_9FLAO|nr:hypothetical protein [Saonia flava]NJB72159.1 hypothetical protein [Saonia flava]